jgi:hypothetical protein
MSALFIGSKREVEEANQLLAPRGEPAYAPPVNMALSATA